MRAAKHEYQPTDSNDDIENMLKMSMSKPTETESSGGYESLASLR